MEDNDLAYIIRLAKIDIYPILMVLSVINCMYSGPLRYFFLHVLDKGFINFVFLLTTLAFSFFVP